MKLIIDSGAIKSDIRIVISDASIESVRLVGFNPYLHDEQYIQEHLEKGFPLSYDKKAISHIYYYGAGCGHEHKCNVVKNAFLAVFPNSEILVHHDLLGAVHALSGQQPGIVCILGTGSNSCAYDGQQIVKNIMSMGYALGDEGSGFDLGRRLIKAYLRDELPLDLVTHFEEKYPGGKRFILQQVYQGLPNQYLAGFTHFLKAHETHPFIRRLIEDRFDNLTESVLKRYDGYQEYPVHFSGSIAFHFQEILKERLIAHQMQIGKIIQQPIDGLVQFHLQQ